MQLDSGIEIGGTSAQPVLNIMNAARERNDRIAAIKRAEDERNRQEFLGLVSRAQHNVQGKYYDSYVGKRDKYVTDLASMYENAQRNGGRIDIKDQIEMVKRAGELESYVANVQQATQNEAEWITKLATLSPDNYDIEATKERLKNISNINDPYVQNQMFANPDGILVRRPYKIDYGKVMGAIKGAVKEVDAERGEKYNVEKARELAGGMWDNDPRAQESVDREKYIDNTISLLPNGKPPYNKKSGSGGKKLKEIGDPTTNPDTGITERTLSDKISSVPVSGEFFYLGADGKMVSSNTPDVKTVKDQATGKMKTETTPNPDAIPAGKTGYADFISIVEMPDGKRYAKLSIGTTKGESIWSYYLGGSDSDQIAANRKEIYVPLEKYMEYLKADYNVSPLEKSSDSKQQKSSSVDSDFIKSLGGSVRK